MQSETALTILCGSAILVIVGMVMLTASNIGLSGASVQDVTGDFYIPTGFEKPIKRSEFTPVEVDVTDPFCVQDAVKECKRINSGTNFIRCTNRAMYDCGKAPLATYCVLPAGFELKYSTKDECLRNVWPECKVKCAPEMVNDCVSLSKGRCLNIGSKYAYVYEQKRYIKPQNVFGLE